MKRQTAIRIKEDLWQWIKEYCKERGLTVTGFITNVIVEKKNKEDKKR